MWENKIDEKVKSWQKIKMGKPLRENPRASGLAEGRFSCANPVPNSCMRSPVGFLVGFWMVFGVVISPVFGTSVPVVAKLIL